MSTILGDLLLRVKGDAGSAQRTLAQTAGSIRSLASPTNLARNAMQGLANTSQTAGTNLGQTTNAGRGFSGVLKDILRNAAGVATGIIAVNGLRAVMQGLIGVGIGWNTQLETSQTKWTTLLGSQEKATEQLEWMKQVAADTPFEFMDLDAAVSRLKAFGFEIGEARDMLIVLGDAASATGTGTEGINRLSLALGQMHAKTKVSSQEMLQLTEMGIPAWEMLADAMGLSIPELQKLVERGLVPANKAIPILMQGMDKAFGGAMQKQAQTFTGKMSTLKDTVRNLLGDAFKPSFEWLRVTALPAVIGLVDRLVAGFAQGGLRGAVLAAFPPQAREMVDSLIEGLSNLGSVLLYIGRVVAPLVEEAIKLVLSTIKMVTDAFTSDSELIRAAAYGVLAAFLAWHTIPGILSVVGKSLVAFAALATSVGRVVFAFQAVVGGAATVGEALTFLGGGPIGWIILAIGALVAVGYLLMKNWDEVERVGLNVFSTMRKYIFNALASIGEAYASFIGVFSDRLAEVAQENIRALRTQADAEERAIEERNRLAGAEARRREAAEREKKEASEASLRAIEEAGKKASDVAEKAAKDADTAQQQTIESFSVATEQKEKYLDEFETTWKRSQDRILTEFERGQDAAVDAFKQAQDDQVDALRERHATERREYERSLEDRRIEFQHQLEDEKTAFQRASEDRQIEFRNGQEDELRSFKRSQEDKLRVFEQALDQEKAEFRDHQETLLNAFRDRQSQEMDLIRRRHDAERSQSDARFEQELSALRGRQDAIRQEEKLEQEQENRTRLSQRVQEARARLEEERTNGKAEAIAKAERDLSEAIQEQEKHRLRLERQHQLDLLNQQIEALRQRNDAERTALKQKQDAEAEALRQGHELSLEQYRKELETAKAALDERLAQRKEAYRREQEDTLEAFQRILAVRKEAFDREQELTKTEFERAQGVRKEQYDRELEDLKSAFTGKQEEALEHLKKTLDMELTHWKHLQEDRKTRYKQELEDLKSSLESKLNEQRAYVRDVAALERQMQSRAPTAPSPTKAPEATTPVMVQSSTPPAKEPEPERKSALPTLTDKQIMDLPYDQQLRTLFPGAEFTPPDTGKPKEEPPDITQPRHPGLRFMARGGVFRRPTVVGDVPEAVTPLTWLEGQMRQFANRLMVNRSKVSAGGTTSQKVYQHFGPLATVNVTGNTILNDYDADRLAEHLGGALVRRLKAEGVTV